MLKASNFAQFLGNVGKDPIVKFFETDGGGKKVSFSVATNYKYKVKNSTEVKEVVYWHSCYATSKLADLIEKYMKKGSYVFVAGQHTSGSYVNKDGVKKYTSEFKVEEIHFLDSKFEKEKESILPHINEEAPAPSTSDDDLPF